MHVGTFMANSLVDTTADLMDAGVGSFIYGSAPVWDYDEIYSVGAVRDNNLGSYICMTLTSQDLNNCWFGWDAGVGKKLWCHGFSIVQMPYGERNVPSVLFQWSDDLVNWNTIGTYTTNYANTRQVVETPRAQARALRIRAGAANANGYWQLVEFELLQTLVK